MLYTHIPDISCFYTNTIGDELALPTAHFEYEMILITSGRGTAVINHKTYDLIPGSLVFINRLERHNFIITEEPYCRYVVSVSSDFILSFVRDAKLLSIFLLRPQNFSHAIRLSEEIEGSILALLQQMKEEYTLQREFFTEKSAVLFLSVLIELYRAMPEVFPMRSHSNMVTAVLNTQRYVSEHFNRKLTLQEIADANYVSRHALSLGFKEIVGITFKEYLLLFRITEAKKLLTTTDLSVAQIAEATGYINVNNFVKIFKEKEHITPLQYRKRIFAPASPIMPT